MQPMSGFRLPDCQAARKFASQRMRIHSIRRENPVGATGKWWKTEKWGKNIGKPNKGGTSSRY